MRKLDEYLSALAERESVDKDRLIRCLTFERFLARLQQAYPDDAFLLKGGFALELRYRKSTRPAVDLDFSIPKGGRVEYVEIPTPASVAGIDLHDGFHFQIGEKTEIAGGHEDGTTYGRARYEVVSRTKEFPEFRFHVDTDLGDFSCPASELIDSWIGLPGSHFRIQVVSLATQFAEKIHAYSLPGRWSERPAWKDLLDLALMAHMGPPRLESIVGAIIVTFNRRFTHPPPKDLPSPENEWVDAFRAQAGQTELPEKEMFGAFERLTGYWRQVYDALPSGVGVDRGQWIIGAGVCGRKLPPGPPRLRTDPESVALVASIRKVFKDTPLPEQTNRTAVFRGLRWSDLPDDFLMTNQAYFYQLAPDEFRQYAPLLLIGSVKYRDPAGILSELLQQFHPPQPPEVVKWGSWYDQRAYEAALARHDARMNAFSDRERRAIAATLKFITKNFHDHDGYIAAAFGPFQSTS